jgi:hypothetical protein
MKILKISTMMVLLTSCFLHSVAQDLNKINNEPDYNKPKLFADLPHKMNLNVSDLETLFSVREGNSIKAMAAANFPLFGTVVSKSDENDASVKTTVINLSNRQGATLTFTRITNDDGTVSYRGRIMSRNNSDAFEIVKENGEYVLIKKGLYDLINE